MSYITANQIDKRQRTERGFNENTQEYMTRTLPDFIEGVRDGEKVYPQETWYNSDPYSLMFHLYWLKGQVPPTNQTTLLNAYRSALRKLGAKHKAPYKDFMHHWNYFVGDYE